MSNPCDVCGMELRLVGGFGEGVYCPLHSAAQQMRLLLEQGLRDFDHDQPPSQEWGVDVRVLLKSLWGA